MEKLLISDYDNEEVVTYEEVEKYYPRLGRYRPLVLLGKTPVILFESGISVQYFNFFLDPFS